VANGVADKVEHDLRHPQLIGQHNKLLLLLCRAADLQLQLFSQRKRFEVLLSAPPLWHYYNAPTFGNCLDF
jgi:hypothetical protein